MCKGTCRKCEICGNCPCHCNCLKTRVILSSEMKIKLQKCGRVDEFLDDFNLKSLNDTIYTKLIINEENNLFFVILKEGVLMMLNPLAVILLED